MTDKRKKIVAAFLLITAVGCFGIMGSILVSDGGNVGQYKTEKQPTKTTNKNKKKKWRNPINWEKIQRVNPEVYAWIKVPDTVIDYPVLQSKNHDDDYYLHHNLQKKYSFAGCIYSRKDNAMDFSDDITVLYGHNMINGSMFAGIKKFSDEDFFEDHKTIYVYTTEAVYEYIIWAYCVTDDKDILSSYTKESYCNAIKKEAEQIRKVNSDSQILTLSTCGTASRTRRLLHCVLVGKHD